MARANEKRSFKREFCKGPVLCEICPTSHTTGLSNIARVRDVAGGRIGLFTKLPLRTDQFVKLGIPFPDSTVSVPVFAEVICLRE